MQTVPAYNSQASYQMGVSVPPSYYTGQSYMDPRGYNNSISQTNFGYNYQPYYNQWGNANYLPYYSVPRDLQAQRQSAQYINPAYHYEYDTRYSNNRDARYHQRVEAYNLPINYSNRTGELPKSPVKTTLQKNSKVPIKQVIYEQQPLNVPQSVRNVQYVPQLHRYMDYVQERVKIPVEKYYTDYYEVEHVTDFVPREYEDTVVEMVPEEIVRYRLEYVPVERKIVHLPKNQIYDEKGLFKGVGNLTDRVQIDQAAIALANEGELRESKQVSRALYNRGNSQIRGLDQSLVDVIAKDIQTKAVANRNSPSLSRQEVVSRTIYQDKRQHINSPTRYGYSKEQITANNFRNMDQSKSRANYSAYGGGSRVSRRKTNFVTSDGYFPNYDEELRNLGTTY